MSELFNGNVYQYMISHEYQVGKFGKAVPGLISASVDSIIFKGQGKTSNMDISCVLKYMTKRGQDGEPDSHLKEFQEHEKTILQKLQGIPSVVKILDIVTQLPPDLTYSRDVLDKLKGFPEDCIISADTHFCVVEEYIAGQTLEEFSRSWAKQLKDNPGNYALWAEYQNRIFSLMQKLCDTLALLEQKGVLHLNLKPEHIMLPNDGRELVLIGFDKARVMNNGAVTVRNQSSFVYGSIGYASSEARVTEKDTVLTILSDIFSFGALFWECLYMPVLDSIETFKCKYTEALPAAAAVHPNYLDTNSNSYYRNMEQQRYYARSLSDVSPYYHEKLEQIIRKCTMENPKERYQSYAELRAAIVDAMQSVPPMQRLKRTEVRMPAAFLGAATALTVFAGGLLLSLSAAGKQLALSQIKALEAESISADCTAITETALSYIAQAEADEQAALYTDLAAFWGQGGLDRNEAESLMTLLQQMAPAADPAFLSEQIDGILTAVPRSDISFCVEQMTDRELPYTGIGAEIAGAICQVQRGGDYAASYQTLLLCCDTLLPCMYEEDHPDQKYINLLWQLGYELNNNVLIAALAPALDMSPDDLQKTVRYRLSNIEMAEKNMKRSEAR